MKELIETCNKAIDAPTTYKGACTGFGIDILLVDAEDMGRPGYPNEWGLGTQSFVKQYKGILPKYAICVDMIADKNPIFKIEKFSYNYAKELVYEIWELANDLGYKEFVWQLTHPIYDDHYYYIAIILIMLPI